MEAQTMKEFVRANPLQAAVVGLVAVLVSPVVILAATPVVQFLLVQLAPVLIPGLTCMCIS
jgi:hypothetical protein